MKKGDFIYSYDSNRSGVVTIIKHEIILVGRVWLETDTRHKVRIENLRTENKQYSQWDIQFFKSEQEIKDMLSAGILKRKVVRYVADNNHKITEWQFKEIAKILGV